MITTRRPIGLLLAAALFAVTPAFAAAPMTIAKTTATVSDPQGDAQPKAVPGSVLDYTVSITNPAAGASNVTGIVYADTIATKTMMYVLNLGSGTSGPVVFNDGSVAGLGGSKLTYTYSGLSSTTDQIQFSSDMGMTWTYTPSPDANGYDGSVTNIRITPIGTQAVGSTFTLRYRVMVR